MKFFVFYLSLHILSDCRYFPFDGREKSSDWTKMSKQIRNKQLKSFPSPLEVSIRRFEFFKVLRKIESDNFQLYSLRGNYFWIFEFISKQTEKDAVAHHRREMDVEKIIGGDSKDANLLHLFNKWTPYILLNSDLINLSWSKPLKNNNIKEYYLQRAGVI